MSFAQHQYARLSDLDADRWRAAWYTVSNAGRQRHFHLRMEAADSTTFSVAAPVPSRSVSHGPGGVVLQKVP
jgi:hypothetical protein